MIFIWFSVYRFVYIRSRGLGFGVYVRFRIGRVVNVFFFVRFFLVGGVFWKD